MINLNLIRCHKEIMILLLIETKKYLLIRKKTKKIEISF